MGKYTTRLDGLVALVTGAGGGARGGMGAAIARCLGEEGAKVVVNDLNEEYANETVNQLRSLNIDAMALVGNIADPEQAIQLVRQTVDHFGQIDILVNNAGIGGRRAYVEDMTDEEWEEVLAVNLHGPFYLSREAIPFMKQRKYGRIINVSSLAAIRVSLFGSAAYTSSKEALIGFTRHLAVEVTQHGITANAILPGYTITPLSMENSTEEIRTRIASGIPSQRGADPEEIGRLAAFLASPAAGQISGTAIPVDGAVSVMPGDVFKRREVWKDVPVQS